MVSSVSCGGNTYVPPATIPDESTEELINFPSLIGRAFEDTNSSPMFAPICEYSPTDILKCMFSYKT